jgi:hypothetical protein
MPKYNTAWLVGSSELPATTYQIHAADYEIPAGHYYLRHSAPLLSLVDRLQADLIDAGYADAAVFVAKDRRVRITSAGDDIDIDWPTQLAALYGFTGNLAGDNSYTAPSVSPLLWSPGKPETPQESPLGTLGRRVYDTQFGTSPDSLQVADSHNTQIVQTFAWSFVPTERFQTVAQDLGTTGTIQGEYTRFFDVVLRNAEHFYLYRYIPEDTASSVAVTWPDPGLGPYGYRPGRGPVSWDFARAAGFKDAERYANVPLDCLVVPEWGEF